MTWLSLYEDLLAPGEKLPLPAGARMVYVASGELAGCRRARRRSATTRRDRGRGGRRDRPALGADRVVGGGREAVRPRRARPMG